MKPIIHLAIIAVCIGAYFLYISPNLQDINDLRLKLSDYRSTLNQAKELKVTLDSMLSTYNSISEEDRTKLAKIIPEKFNDIAFVSDVSGIVQRNSMSIKSIVLSDSNPSSNNGAVVAEETLPYKVATMTLTVDGQYEQFVKMLKDMESNLQLLDVKSVTINEGKKENGVYSFSYTINLETYYLR